MRYGTLRHHLRDFPAVGMDIFVRKASWPDQELQPARSLALSAGLGATQAVALGDNTDQVAVIIDDGQSADPVVEHQFHHFGNRGVGSVLTRRFVS